MPTASRIYVKTSILYLAVGATLGALLLINRWTPLGIWLLSLKVTHAQFLVVGWLSQLILGVAWWLFPPLKIGLRPDEARPMRRGQAQRGSEPLFWLTFACLNLGILLRGIFEPLHVWTSVQAFQAISGLSGLFLFAAALTFVLNMWNRVRALGKDR